MNSLVDDRIALTHKIFMEIWCEHLQPRVGGRIEQIQGSNDAALRLLDFHGSDYVWASDVIESPVCLALRLLFKVFNKKTNHTMTVRHRRPDGCETEFPKMARAATAPPGAIVPVAYVQPHVKCLVDFLPGKEIAHDDLNHWTHDHELIHCGIIRYLDLFRHCKSGIDRFGDGPVRADKKGRWSRLFVNPRDGVEFCAPEYSELVRDCMFFKLNPRRDPPGQMGIFGVDNATAAIRKIFGGAQ